MAKSRLSSPILLFKAACQVVVIATIIARPQKRTDINTPSKIVGGTATIPFEFPWIALLTFSPSADEDSELRTCGGSLIHPEYVMTAAHCTYRLPLYVTLGRYDLSRTDEKEERFSVRRIYRHPLYESSKSGSPYDIALLRLSSPSVIRPASIAGNSLGDYTKENRELTIAGWGKLGYSESKLPDQMQKANVPMVGLSRCQKAYPFVEMSELYLCAGDLEKGGRDSCQGDSGGPLFLQLNSSTVFGVVSFGINCGDADYPGVYTNVAKMIEWMHTIIPKHELVPAEQRVTPGDQVNFGKFVAASLQIQLGVTIASLLYLWV